MAKKNSLAKKVFIAVCATLISSFVLGSISSLLKKDDDDHTHKWGSGEITLPATCTSDGEILYECSCGKTKIEVISAGHVDADDNFECDRCFNSLASQVNNIDGVGTYYIFIPEEQRGSSFDVLYSSDGGSYLLGTVSYDDIKNDYSFVHSRFLNLEKAIQFSLFNDYLKMVVTDAIVHDVEYGADFSIADGLYIDFMIIEGYQVYKEI